MAITLLNSQGSSLHTTADTLNITQWSDIVAGDIQLLVVACKYPPASPSGPTGWTLIGSETRATGTQGMDSGPLTASLFVRVCDGSEAGEVIQVGSTGSNLVGASLDVFRADTGNVRCTADGGVQEVSSTSWSISVGDIGLVADDLLVVLSVGQNLIAGPVRSGHAVVSAGVTFGAATEIRDGGWSSGHHLATWAVAFPVTDGPSSSGLTYEALSSIAEAGVSFAVRLREISAPETPETITPTSDLLGDVALEWSSGLLDAVIASDDLVADGGLRTSVLLSLFIDRRAQPDDELPGDDDDRRGWWADEFAASPGDRMGSRLWLLERTSLRPGLAARAEDLAREALAWMIEDKVASAVLVTATVTGPMLELLVTVERPDAEPVAYRFSHVWTAETSRS